MSTSPSSSRASSPSSPTTIHSTPATSVCSSPNLPTAIAMAQLPPSISSDDIMEVDATEPAQFNKYYDPNNADNNCTFRLRMIDGKTARTATPEEAAVWSKVWKPKYLSYYRSTDRRLPHLDRHKRALEKTVFHMKLIKNVADNKRFRAGKFSSRVPAPVRRKRVEIGPTPRPIKKKEKKVVRPDDEEEEEAAADGMNIDEVSDSSADEDDAMDGGEGPFEREGRELVMEEEMTGMTPEEEEAAMVGWIEMQGY